MNILCNRLSNKVDVKYCQSVNSKFTLGYCLWNSKPRRKNEPNDSSGIWPHMWSWGIANAAFGRQLLLTVPKFTFLLHIPVIDFYTRKKEKKICVLINFVFGLKYVRVSGMIIIGPIYSNSYKEQLLNLFNCWGCCSAGTPPEQTFTNYVSNYIC